MIVPSLAVFLTVFGWGVITGMGLVMLFGFYSSQKKR